MVLTTLLKSNGNRSAFALLAFHTSKLSSTKLYEGLRTVRSQPLGGLTKECFEVFSETAD